MKGTHFAAGLAVSLCLTVPMLAVFAMPECQLSRSQADMEACFERVSFGRNTYLGAMALFLMASILLQSRCSKWTPWALVGLAVSPWLIIYAT
jgi:hypothetical protein